MFTHFSVCVCCCSVVIVQALTDSGLGESVIGGGLSSELLQNTYSIGLKVNTLTTLTSNNNQQHQPDTVLILWLSSSHGTCEHPSIADPSETNVERDLTYHTW